MRCGGEWRTGLEWGSGLRHWCGGSREGFSRHSAGVGNGLSGLMGAFS